MQEINKAVSTAQRRLAVGQLFSILTWAAFISLLIAAIGVAIPKSGISGSWKLKTIKTLGSTHGR